MVFQGSKKRPLQKSFKALWRLLEPPNNTKAETPAQFTLLKNTTLLVMQTIKVMNFGGLFKQTNNLQKSCTALKWSPRLSKLYFWTSKAVFVMKGMTKEFKDISSRKRVEDRGRQKYTETLGSAVWVSLYVDFLYSETSQGPLPVGGTGQGRG